MCEGNPTLNESQTCFISQLLISVGEKSQFQDVETHDVDFSLLNLSSPTVSVSGLSNLARTVRTRKIGHKY